MKILKLGTLLISMLFILTGCSASGAERIINANKKMDNLDNYRMQMLITMAISNKEEKRGIAVSLRNDAKIDMKNQTVYIETQTNMFGYDLKLLMYTTRKGNNMVVYNTVEGAEDWAKSTGTIEKISDQIDMIGDIIGIVTSGTQVSDQGTENGITHYTVTLTKESVGELFKTSGDMTGVAQGKDYEVAGPLKIDVFINNDDYITAMNIDFTDVIIMKTANGDIKIDQFKMDFGFSEFNKIGKVTVPKDIVDNAVETK